MLERLDLGRLLLGCKLLTIFAKNSIRDVRLVPKYISDIQTFERKTQQKFVSRQNKLLAKSFFQRYWSLCKIYKPLLKVSFSSISIFLDLSTNVPQCHLYCDIKIFLCSCISCKMEPACSSKNFDHPIPSSTLDQ